MPNIDWAKWNPTVLGIRWSLGPSMVFSPDGSRSAFVERIKDISFLPAEHGVVEDGGGHRRYALVRKASLVFSPNGRRLAYSVNDFGTEFAVLNETDGERYNRVWSLVLAPTVNIWPASPRTTRSESATLASQADLRWSSTVSKAILTMNTYQPKAAPQSVSTPPTRSITSPAKGKSISWLKSG